jgi:hypothetical protein
MTRFRQIALAAGLLVGVLSGTANAALNAYLNLSTTGIVSPRDPQSITLYVKLEKFVGQPSGRHDALLSSSAEELKKDNPALKLKTAEIMVIAVSHEELSKAGLTVAGLKQPRLVSMAIGAIVFSEHQAKVTIDLR